jgi:hypothetical protein
MPLPHSQSTRTKQTTYSLSLTNSNNVLYCLGLLGHRQSVPPQVMRLRRAVLQIPAKSSVPPRLPVYKSRSILNPSESTLLQVLIPLHFISFISNTYKKPGGGSLFKPQSLATRYSPNLTLHLCLFPSLPHYVFTSSASARAQQHAQPQPPLWFTSRFSGYPGVGCALPAGFQISIFVFRVSCRQLAVCRVLFWLSAVSCQL